MTLGTLLAIICLVIGFLVGASVFKLWMDALEWFVAAIAIVMSLGGVGPVIVGSRRPPPTAP